MQAAGDELAAVQARRAHPHQHLAGARLGRRRIAQLQHDLRAVDAEGVRLQGSETAIAMAYSAQPGA